MKECGWRKPESAIEQQLPSRGNEQVSATHYFRNLHRSVINDHRQLIGRHAIMPPNHKVAEILSCNERLRTDRTIIERNGFAIRHTETPGESAVAKSGSRIAATRPRINQFIIA